MLSFYFKPVIKFQINSSRYDSLFSLTILLKFNFKVMLRPHFKIMQDSADLINLIKEKFGKNPNFILETGVIPTNLFHNSICLISDWSGISFEYAGNFNQHYNYFTFSMAV